MRGNGCAPATRDPALLGVDLAGDAVTSVVTDLAGRVLATARARVVLSRPRPGWVEADPLDWLAAATVTIRRAVHEAGVRPQAVGLSGQTHGLVLVDAAGLPVRPAVLRPDGRAVLRLGAYQALPDQLRRNLGNPLSPAMAGPVLSWIAVHEPRSAARARWVLQPKDWLRAQLTGDYRSEPSDASATLLYDLVTDEWSAEAAQRLGLDPGRLPEILPGAGHQAGLLTRSGADLIGLRSGTPVAAGAARPAAAALGSGLVEGSAAQFVLGPGPHVVASIGTLPASLPLTGETHIYRAATDRGWCVTASVSDRTAASSGPGRVRRMALDIAAAVRSVSTLAPVSRFQVRGTDHAPPGLLAMLAELVDQPVHPTNAPEPAARAAALLGARAAGLLDEETLRAQFVPSTSPTVESKETTS